MEEDNKYKSHPSYGMISVSRCQGGSPVFFGSHVKNHPGYVSLKISHGERKHDLGQDWFFSGKQIIGVRMTFAQFSNLITSFNVGSGVPCTVEFIEGSGRIQDPPDNLLEAERVREDFQNKCSKLEKTISKYYTNLDSILNKKSLNKEDRKEIRNMFQKVSQEVKTNLPFILESFQESAEKIITHAKYEVDGFMNMILRNLGVEALKEGKISNLLGEKKDKTK